MVSGLRTRGPLRTNAGNRFRVSTLSRPACSPRDIKDIARTFRTQREGLAWISMRNVSAARETVAARAGGRRFSCLGRHGNERAVTNSAVAFCGGRARARAPAAQADGCVHARARGCTGATVRIASTCIPLPALIRRVPAHIASTLCTGTPTCRSTYAWDLGRRPRGAGRNARCCFRRYCSCECHR